MQLFKIVTLAATAASLVFASPTPGGRVEIKESVNIKIKFDAKFYKTEGYRPASSNKGYGDYKVPHFEFPPIDVRIKECADRFGLRLHLFFGSVREAFHQFGADVKLFFHDVHKFFHHLHEKMSDGWHRFWDKVHDKLDCVAFKLHVAWRKFESDAARVKFWMTCEKAHFRHWCEYRRRVCAGELEIKTKFAHEMMCALREFEAREAEAYRKREEECRSADISMYGQDDEDYVTIVGREDLTVKGTKLNLKLKEAINIEGSI